LILQNSAVVWVDYAARFDGGGLSGSERGTERDSEKACEGSAQVVTSWVAAMKYHWAMICVKSPRKDWAGQGVEGVGGS